jgi:hypothetical protein
MGLRTLAYHEDDHLRAARAVEALILARMLRIAGKSANPHVNHSWTFQKSELPSGTGFG